MPRGDTSLPGAVANGNKFSRRKMEMKALCIVHARECERERQRRGVASAQRPSLFLAKREE